MKDIEPSETAKVGGGLPSRTLEELPWVEVLPVTQPIDYNPLPPEPR